MKIFGTPPTRAGDGDGDIQNADVYLDHKFLHFLSQRILKEALEPFEFSILSDGEKSCDISVLSEIQFLRTMCRHPL